MNMVFMTLSLLPVMDTEEAGTPMLIASLQLNTTILH